MYDSKVDIHRKNKACLERDDGSWVLLPVRGRQHGLEILRFFDQGLSTNFELSRVEYDLRSVGVDHFLIVLDDCDSENAIVDGGGHNEFLQWMISEVRN